MSFSEIQLAQETAANIEVSPSGKIINENDGLTTTSSQKALPTVPKIAQGKTKRGLHRKRSIYNGGGGSTDPEPENQSNRKESDQNDSNNETAGTGSESLGQEKNRRKMSKLKIVKSSKKLAKSMSKTTRSAKTSKSRSKTNKSGPAGQQRGVSTGGKSKVLLPRSTLNPNLPNSDNGNGSGSIQQPVMGGSSELSGTGTGTGTGTFSSNIPHPTVNKKSTYPKGELLNILKSKSISSMGKMAPKSKSNTNTNTNTSNIRDTRTRGKSPKLNPNSNSGNIPSTSTNNKIQNQLPKHADKDRNQNNTKKKSGPPPAVVFTTITPAFFSRLNQITKEGNSNSPNNNAKDHSTGKSITNTNSNSKHNNNKKDKQSRSRSSRSSISFNEAREALSLQQQDVGPTVSVPPEEISPVNRNNVEGFKMKVNLPSKQQQHYISQSQSGSPRNAKEFISNSNNPFQHSQTRISSSAGASSGSRYGTNSSKPILTPCHGTGCHSTTFPMKRHIRFADSDGNANHQQDSNNYLEMSSSYSNNTKMRSSNLMGGCLK